MKIISNFRNLLIVVLLHTVSVNIQAQSSIVAEIPVSYDVPASGTFQYSVPLRIPPGIMDMVPNLAITYSSQSGDGNMGVGWSLTGLSAITRGVPTIYHDQKIEPVDFNNDDVFFIDGQRLFWESSTSSYLTQVKNFAIIKKHGTAGTGPSHFTVEYPNGTVAEYGNSTSSKMLAQGKSDALMWVVNKITDVHNNEITFEYTNSQSSGEYRILQIVYSQNSLTTNDLPVTIDFNYGITRLNTNTAYVNGSQINNTVLLEDINIKFSDLSTANKYEFSYDQASIHPRLQTIVESRDGNTPLEPININWGPTGNPVTNNPNYGTTLIGPIGGDFNGDGYADLASSVSLTSTTQLKVRINNGSSLPTVVTKTLNFVVPQVNNGVTTSELQARQVIDYNGDGMDDIILMEHFGNKEYKLWLLKANGNATTVFDNPVQIHYGINNQSGNGKFYDHLLTTLGDYDGDGKTEVIVFEPYNFISSNEVQDYEVFVVGDEYGSHQINHYNGNHISNLMTVDYNGDGKNEFSITELSKLPASTIFVLNVGYDVTTKKPYLIQTPSQWPMQFYSPSTYPKHASKTWTGDFNGDGRSDLIENDGLSWIISYSSGAPWTSGVPSPAYSTNVQTITGTNHPMAALNSSPPFNTLGAYGCYPADFNGDGLCDFLELTELPTNPVTYYFRMFYSTGNSFASHTGTINIDAHTEMNTIGDYNGDGQMDIKHLNGILSFFEDNNSNRVTSISHGGKVINVDYESIVKDGDYAPITPTNNEFSSRTVPLKVVKQLSVGGDIENKYTYEGFTFHKYGLGVRGFKKFTVENKAQQKTYQTFELETTVPYLKESKVFDPLGTLQYGTLTTYQQLDFSGGAGDKSRIIINSPLKVTDNISGAATITTITTGSTSPGTVFYDFGKVESTSIRTKNLIGGLNSLQTTTYDYGTNWATLKGKPESVTVYSDIDPAGANSLTRTTDYAYYSNGDLQTVITDPGTINETVTDYQYDYQTTGDPYGHVTQTDLTANGVVGTITNESSYTSDGRFMASEINAMGYTSTYNYGNLVHSWGNVESETDYKGLQTQYEYDDVNRLRKVTDVISNIETTTDYEWATSSSYASSLTGAHMVIKISNSYDNVESAKVIDVYGRTLREVSPGFLHGSAYQDYTYNSNGQVETATSPYYSLSALNYTTTTFTYDAWGRETESNTDNGGPVTQTSYSVDLGTGLLHTTVTNQGANTWKKTITCGKTLWSIVNSGTPNHTIDYTYHGNGTMATTIVNDAGGNGKAFTNIVDQYGRITDKTQPNAGTISYSYDALDRVITETRANGTVYQYDYDLLDRMTQKSISGQTTPYTYTYENINGTGSTGKLLQETSPNGHVKDYTYHPQGWLHKIDEDNFFETIYSYYPNGDLFRYTFDGDITIEYDYFHSGVVKNATLISGAQFPTIPAGGQRLWDGWTLTPRGQRTGGYFYEAPIGGPGGPGYGYTYTYDVHGLLERHQMNNTATGTIADNWYSFDVHTGNLNWRSDAMPMRNHTEYFTYNNHYDRLSTVSQSISGGPSVQTLNMGYDDDGHGNITEKDDAAPVHPNQLYAKWKYDDYALETVQLPPGSNVPFPASVSIPHYTQEIVYTPFEKIERMTEANNNEVVFTYGSDDTRIHASYYDLAGGGAPNLLKTKTYYNNYERIDYASGGTDELFYVWAGDQLITILKVFSFPGQPSVSNVYYPMLDHLGSITHLLDNNLLGGTASNGIVEERSFDAWGRARDPNNWQAYPIGGHPGFWITDRGYTSHEHIWMPTVANMYDNNIINMGGRLYDPLVGRMFSPDPYIPDGTNTQDYNKYIYARNNPLKYNDPDGNFVNIVLGAAVGGFAGYQIGKTNDATGGEMLKYIGIGAGIGLASGGMAAGVSAIGLGAFFSGAAGGAVAGAGFSGLATDWDSDAMWKGAGIGAMSAGGGAWIGGTLGGGWGALASGGAGAATNEFLNGGDGKDILAATLFGGLSSYSMYYLTSYINWQWRGGKTWNGRNVGFKGYMTLQADFQRSRLHTQEYGGNIKPDGTVTRVSKDKRHDLGISAFEYEEGDAGWHTHYEWPGRDRPVDDNNDILHGSNKILHTTKGPGPIDLKSSRTNFVINRWNVAHTPGDHSTINYYKIPLIRYFTSFNFYR